MGVAIDELHPGGRPARPGAHRPAHAGRLRGDSLVTSWLQTCMMVRWRSTRCATCATTSSPSCRRCPCASSTASARGDLMSRLTNDMENISTVLSAERVTQLVSGVLPLIGVAVVMLLLNWRLALVALIVVPLDVATSPSGSPRTPGRASASSRRRWGQAERPHRGDDHRPARRQGLRPRRTGDGRSSTSPTTACGTPPLARRSFPGSCGPMVNFVNNIGFAIVAGAGGWMTVHRLATVGTIASLHQLCAAVRPPAERNRQPVQHRSRRRSPAPSASSRPSTKCPSRWTPPDALPLGRRSRGDVVFDDVTFGYEAGRARAESTSACTREPGQTVALVGPTGAGKTTHRQPAVAVLRHRLRRASASTAVTSATSASDDLRRQLGIVLQDTFLFSGTVMDEHPLRPAGRHRRRGHGRGPAGERRPVHPPPAARLRDAAVERGRQPEPGPAPAARHRARASWPIRAS